LKVFKTCLISLETGQVRPVFWAHPGLVSFENEHLSDTSIPKPNRERNKKEE
jgi:hypothetical protein